MKKKKPPGDIIILHMCTKNSNQIMYGSWDMVDEERTDRQANGGKEGRTGEREEKMTYRGGCPT